MKKMCIFLLLCMCFFIAAGNGFCSEKIRIVTSTLDMADVASQVGGNKVDVYAITHGQYDLHFYEPKPSQVIKMKKADLLIVGGLGIDDWINGLIDAARNPDIRFGAKGFVDPSVGVTAKDVPTEHISGNMGDIHPHGNPHFWFNPENVEITARNIADGLVRVAPEDEVYFTERRDAYIQEVQSTFERLRSRLQPYRGTKVLQFHESWNYFCDYFGLKLAGNIEAKPGIPPSAKHLKGLITKIREEQIKVVFVEPYYPEKPLRFLQSKTDIRVLRLPLFLGGDKESKTYLQNLELIVDRIAEALEE